MVQTILRGDAMQRLAATLTAVFLGLSLGSASSDDRAEREQDPIIGTWTFEGTLQEAPAPAIRLFGMVTFNVGGTLIENDADDAPSPGVRNTPALGSCTRTGP